LESRCPLNVACIGRPGAPQTDAARQLVGRSGLPDPDVQQIALLRQFGQLIGNTGMYSGKLSLHATAAGLPAGRRRSTADGMLPTLYAPTRRRAALGRSGKRPQPIDASATPFGCSAPRTQRC
jgi:hypothetical protein